MTVPKQKDVKLYLLKKEFTNLNLLICGVLQRQLELERHFFLSVVINFVFRLQKKIASDPLYGRRGDTN